MMKLQRGKKEEKMKKKNIILTTIFLLFLGSCMTKKTSTKSSSSSNNGSDVVYDNSGNTNTGGTGGTGGTTTPGTGYGDGEEDGTPDAGQTVDYITLSNISLHGTAGLNRYYPNGGPLWSSATNIGSSDQGIFYTDSKFNIRVRAQAAPGQSTNDSNGVKCAFVAKPYKKLNIDICVRKQNSSCIYTKTFENVPIGQVSKVKEFTVPSSGTPLIVEVLGVQWDYSCQNYLDQGYSINDPALSGYCPMGLVWDTSCVKFDIQFATDYTKDFPASAPRY